MYTQFFALDRPPFRITPDTKLFYSGAKRGAILDALVYAVMNGEGIIKVVGEVGSGKTMLCRMLETRLPRHVKIVYLSNPSLSPDNILQAIAYELNIAVAPDSNKLEVMQKLQNYLLKQHSENNQTVVFIEEAQGMPLATLEEIRLLSNLETESSKLMQLVLFGQPELDQNLAERSIRQLRERITHNFVLEPLEVNEVFEYLNFRMWVSGFRGPELFSKRVAKKITQYSKGLIRRINILADKTLLASYADGTRTITPKHVNTAAEDSQFKKPSVFIRERKALLIFTPVLLSGVLFGLLLFRLFIPSSDTEASNPSLLENNGHKNLEEKHRHVTHDLVLKTTEGNNQLAHDPASEKNPLTPLMPDTIDEWLSDSKIRLLSASIGDYSIQLQTLENVTGAQFSAFMNKLPAVLKKEELYFVDETKEDGNTVLSVLYRDFQGARAAFEALQALPDELSRWTPFVRPIKRIKQALTHEEQEGIKHKNDG